MVQECIVFGDGRPQVGALLLPSDTAAELSKDKAAYIKAVWPVIAEANEKAPSHSRILPEMIDVLPYGTDIPVVGRSQVDRRNVLTIGDQNVHLATGLLQEVRW